MWFTGGNVLICLKYLYNKACEFCCQLNAPQASFIQFNLIPSLDPSFPKLTEASWPSHATQSSHLQC